MPQTKEYHQEYYKRKKLDPEWYAKHKEKSAQRHRDNPVPSRERAKQYVAENKDEQNLKRKERRQQNLAAHREKEKAYIAANKESVNKNEANRRAKKYGLTLEQYVERMQQEACAICNLPFASTKDRHLDHCHTTGKVRGVLCNRCNLGLGYFKDDPKRLQNAIQYLAEP